MAAAENQRGAIDRKGAAAIDHIKAFKMGVMDNLRWASAKEDLVWWKQRTRSKTETKRNGQNNKHRHYPVGHLHVPPRGGSHEGYHTATERGNARRPGQGKTGNADIDKK